ncbi:enkurin-like [Antedon mediterranea]|uniref:enkurin-like n=1 Tax=Antedon mediterranea TaxID=105859 RepID=UPI003AF854E0
MATESIYRLIPKEEIKPPKEPMYKSTFRGRVKEETKTNKSPSKTMGPAKVEQPKTSEFLKRRSGEHDLSTTKPFKYSDDDRKRPPVPKATEKPLMGLKSNKNFVKTNAVENILSVPKKPAANFADTVRGATHPLDPSGLKPVYTRMKKYGNVPDYLTKRNDEVKRAQEEYDEYIKEHYRRGAMKSLSDNERKSIIDGLKKNWEEIHHQYQGLSMVTDTAPKKARKERLESEMKQLERDIELLEKHNIIYISN